MTFIKIWCLYGIINNTALSFFTDSVFAPKDDIGEMDEEEKELEAFKRFCFNSVPPQQKRAKVNLDLKNLSLKKK